MKTLIKFYCCIFFLLLTNFLYSQENYGTIIFRPYPIKDKLYIKIQDSVYTTPKIILPSGKHEVVLWSLNKIQLDTTIQIFPDSVTIFKGFMHTTSSYTLYNKSLTQHYRKVTLPKILSLCISTGLTIGTILYYPEIENQWNRVENSYNSYQSSSPYDIIETEQNLRRTKDEYKKKKEKFTIIGIATGVSWTISALIFYKLRNKKKPTLFLEEPPFQISYAPTFDNNKANGYQLTFTFIKKINNE